MFSLLIECGAPERDFLIAELSEMGSAGIVELDARYVRAFFEDGTGRRALLDLYPGATLRVEEARDWTAFARDLFQSLEVGRRFYLAPAWRDDPTPPGRFRIAVNPGLAFGTGAHETTQLCMEAMEDYLKPGMSVLDVGTGSGILACAAGLLGAGSVFACDTDPVAIGIASALAGSARRFVGSVDAVAPESADLVLANISPEAIAQLAPDLLRARKPGGILLASGFEGSEVDAVRAAFPAPLEVREKGAWALMAIH